MLQNGKLTPTAKFELRHNSQGTINQDVSYVQANAVSTKFSLTPAPTDTQSLGLGLNYHSKNGITSNINWLGSIGSNSYHANALQLNVRLAL